MKTPAPFKLRHVAPVMALAVVAGYTAVQIFAAAPAATSLNYSDIDLSPIRAE